MKPKIETVQRPDGSVMSKGEALVVKDGAIDKIGGNRRRPLRTTPSVHEVKVETVVKY